MKKQYTNPTVEVVFIEGANIVTESVGYNNESVSGVKAQSNRRGGDIWGEGDE